MDKMLPVNHFFKRAIPVVLLLFLIGVFNACEPKQKNNINQQDGDLQTYSETVVPELVDFNLHVKPILSDRCFACHGPDANKRDSGYRIDTQEGAFSALKDKPHVFGIVPGAGDSSEVVSRIFSDDPNLIMPPPASNLTLSANEKEIIKKWINQGAEWKKHWSFIPVKEPQKPALASDWATSDIDLWVAQKHQEKNLRPSQKASKERLIRRVSFDLTGLPPSDEIKASFLADNSEEALEKAIDQLMQSKSYGEHMASEWLELARYSDTHGYQDDIERIMWPWRDWVIKAFNDKMPYDVFVKWQLAGDLLPNPTKEQILATGFNRNHKITQEGGVIPEEYRTEYVLDRTNTFGKAFLGLSLECAQCHDHKYDPISQKDYFSTYAFFNSVPEKGRIEYGEIPEPKLEITDQDLKGILSFVNAEEFKGGELSVMVMQDSTAQKPTFVLNRGSYENPGERVYPTTPEAINPFDQALSKDRLGLANWLFTEDNPLTARVTVNRIWQSFFGTGIVDTPGDFGSQGSLPSHPELLDYLAYELMRSGWNMQHVQKLILTSATYQQSSRVSDALLEIDPKNTWLARGPRYRRSFETIRDNALAISGLLNEEVGGPSVKPYQPDGLWAETTSGQGLTKYIQDNGSKLYRRSLYTFWKRTVPPPSMITFDAATRDLCEVNRQKTNTPLQALVLMNDPQLLEASRVLAYKTLANATETSARLTHAFDQVVGRLPTAKELSIVEDFYNEEARRFKASDEQMSTYLNVGQYPQEVVSAEAAALMSVINAMFNLDEAISKT